MQVPEIAQDLNRLDEALLDYYNDRSHAPIDHFQTVGAFNILQKSVFHHLQLEYAINDERKEKFSKILALLDQWMHLDPTDGLQKFLVARYIQLFYSLLKQDPAEMKKPGN
jgi:hypothetical protein